MSSSVKDILQKKGVDKEEIRTKNFIPTTNQLISLNSDNIEEAAVTSLHRLMTNWDRTLESREQELQAPEDYGNLIHEYWETYQKIKVNMDASFAFIAGDILNSCRKRFFETEEKNFKSYLETKIPFSIRLAYDFMAISKELSLFKNKKLPMEKLRALLSVSRSGFDLSQLHNQADRLEVKEILSFKAPTQKVSKINISMKIGQLTLTALTLEKQVNSIFIENKDKKLTEKQLYDISCVQEKIKSILSNIDNNISCYLN